MRILGIARIINSSGTIVFDKAGTIGIEVTYTDGKHQPKHAYYWLTAKLAKPTLRITRYANTNYINNKNKSGDNAIFDEKFTGEKENIIEYYKIIVKQGLQGYINIYSNYVWNYSLANYYTNSVAVSRSGDNLTYYANIVGTNTIYINEPKSGECIPIIIEVMPSNLIITRQIDNSNFQFEDSEDIIEGFERTWKIESNCEWEASAPDVGIIKLTNQNKRDNTLTYKAISASKVYNRKKGRIDIELKEKKTREVCKTIKIYVKPRVQSIEITNKNIDSLTFGDKIQLQAKTKPNNYVGKAGYGKISWKSDNTGVATVDINNGTVHCKREGKAKITVTYDDGRKSMNPNDELPSKTIEINVIPKTTAEMKTKMIIDSAKKIKQYIADNGYEYCLIDRNNGCQHYYDGHKCGLTFNYADSKIKGKEGYHNTCCANFVCWVLIDAGIITKEEATNFADLNPVCETDKFSIQESDFKASDIKAGDILIYTDGIYAHAHVEIAAKDGVNSENRAFVYNAGGFKSIHNEPEGGDSAYTIYNMTRKLRIK